MATDQNSIIRLDYLIIGLMLILTFFLVNAQQYGYAFFIYLVMGGVSIFFNYFWGRISKTGDLEGLGKNWIRNFFIGIGLGIATFFINSLFPTIGVIGIPPTASVVGDVAKFWIVVISAPIIESIFFLSVMVDFFNSKLGWNRTISILVMSASASLFHFTAYGSQLLSSSGALFSAFVMFALFGWLAEKQNDLSGAIAWHMVMNYYISVVQLAVIFG